MLPGLGRGRHNGAVSEAFVSVVPAEIGASQRYDLLVGAVQPRPIALVSTLDGDGSPNLAPFSFFMAGGNEPASVMVSAASKGSGGWKDSLRNAEATGEFVVNFVVREMAEGMNATSFGYPRGFDEWSVAGFDPIPSTSVKPPRVAQSPIQFECALFQILRHGEGPGAANYMVGEVLRMHVRTDLWDGRGLAADSFRPIARLGSDEYLDTRAMEIFHLKRPSGPAEPSV